MTDGDTKTGGCERYEVNEERMEEAVENTKALSEAATSLVDAAVAETARESGRTVEEQWERMGDHFEYQAVEQDPEQRQLDDYEITGDRVEVVR